MGASTLTDEEFSTLIAESMGRQSRAVTVHDPRARRWSAQTKDHGLYIGLFQFKVDDCLCSCQQDGEHCGHCVAVERGLFVRYEPTESDFAQVRGLPSPA